MPVGRGLFVDYQDGVWCYSSVKMTKKYYFTTKFDMSFINIIKCDVSSVYHAQYKVQ